jgi:hypothetical protein
VDEDDAGCTIVEDDDEEVIVDALGSAVVEGVPV